VHYGRSAHRHINYLPRGTQAQSERPVTCTLNTKLHFHTNKFTTDLTKAGFAANATHAMQWTQAA